MQLVVWFKYVLCRGKVKALYYSSSLTISFVGRRGSPKNARHNDQALFNIEIVNNAVIAHPAPPCGFLPLEAFKVSLEGIGLHGDQRRLNARLISFWELLEVLLCRPGD